MADQKILREYLVALGFKRNPAELNKFTDDLNKTHKNVAVLGKGILGVAAAVTTMAVTFMSKMTDMYYASKRAESSVGNIQALQYASEQVGVSAGNATAAVTNMAKTLREQPGMRGFLESIVGPTAGRDNVELMLDLIDKLKKLPFFQGSQIAGLFGIDSDTLFMLEQQSDELRKAYDLRKQMNKEAGVDADKAAATSRAWSNGFKEIMAHVETLRDAMAIKLLPVFENLVGVTKLVLDDWKQIVDTWRGSEDFIDRMLEGMGIKKRGGGVKLSADSQRRVAAGEAGPAPYVGAYRVGTEKGRGTTGMASSALFADLERRYGLPTGLLDRMWAQESGRGTNMRSKAGAMGHFQFMPDTAKEYGLKNPYDLTESAGAAARKMHDLLSGYNGDLGLALAAYNFGQGNLQQARLGKKDLPAETSDYVKKIAGVDIQQTNHYHITEQGSPQAVRKAVEAAQTQTNADLVRNLKVVVQ